MTRPIDRTHEARIGAGAASLVDDPRLRPDTSVNGAPPLIRGEDKWTSVARVRCAGCSHVVATLWTVNRGTRGMLLAAEVQIVEDWEPSPPRSRTAQMEVLPDAELVADCPAHGRLTFAGSVAIDAARKGMVNVASGASAMTVMHVQPSGARAPLPPSSALPLDEMKEWLGW